MPSPCSSETGSWRLERVVGHDAAAEVLRGLILPEDSLKPSRMSEAIKSDGRNEMTQKYRGQCFCGKVEVEVTGSPVEMGYCHCSSCRSYSGGPVNAFT